MLARCRCWCGCGYWLRSSAFNVARTVKFIAKAGAAALHIEDRKVGAKRCGHRPNKSDRLERGDGRQNSGAVDARTDPNFCDHGATMRWRWKRLEAALDRAQAYMRTRGADMLFGGDHEPSMRTASSPTWRRCRSLANITEFGATPLFTTDELRSAIRGDGVISLSAFRAANRRRRKVHTVLRREGTQKNVIDIMQTRNELYESINYYQFEEKRRAVQE